eukprot:TRINITY_DN5390_c0_g1_i2.p2 TRINITY_DN5390_c0_g1~~TRINITY_DN5390_c0_g1_i2.p2  ORF type:complete len:128 (+),score=26.18 TRINITY_DN5390_c0_g1_i2:825-1208(+)
MVDDVYDQNVSPALDDAQDPDLPSLYPFGGASDAPATPKRGQLLPPLLTSSGASAAPAWLSHGKMNYNAPTFTPVGCQPLLALEPSPIDSASKMGSDIADLPFVPAFSAQTPLATPRLAVFRELTTH